MGRAKLNLELIPKKKSRHTTFKKRKEGLIKKMHELTTLCDVKACMIIYGPKQDEMDLSEPETWPQNTDETRQILDIIYKPKSKHSNNKTFGLSDFFDDRQRKIEDELSRLKKKNRELQYPTWPEFMNFMTVAGLREFTASLVHKAGIVKSRIEFLRTNGLIDNNQLGMHFPAIHHNSHPMIDHHRNSIMMLLMNDHRSVQLGPDPSSQQVFYEAAADGQGVVDPAAMTCHSPMQLARYYGPSLPPVPYMHVMPQRPHAAVSSYMQMPPEMQFPAKAESGDGFDGGEGQEDAGMMGQFL